MNTLLTSVFILMASFSASAQLGNDFKLPQTWEKDFTITLSFHSSMSGSKTNIKFTHDSVKYLSSSRSKGPKEKTYLLKEADRIAILKKLQELKADQIKSESGIRVVNDGWSQSICFNSHCIEGGSSVEMNEKNKNQFLDAYRYLEEFAIKKCK